MEKPTSPAGGSPRRRKLRSAHEMFPLVAQWQESGQLQADFCHARQIPTSSFTYWVKKYRMHLSGSAPSSFLPVSVTQPFVEEPAEMLELIFPNAVRLRIPTSLSPSLIRELAGQC